ncbi:DUF1688 domain-containing protein [Paecilomyces variotii No. 5]|uniref:DUF1688 domain-containing protein n=1 Tax=Byssochlamys spectabilis (strain No. 5 / NBRC 109023) TaxID=1356009 RepID=V5FT93_BYSSN|nr:DUF1688 domain-containing protein [Paecilomyces variotii No. 5]
MGAVDYLLSLEAVRERATKVYNIAVDGKLKSFDYHEDRMADAADFVASLIMRDFGPDRFHEIPPHGRWQHFEAGNIARVTELLHEWKVAGQNKAECARRLVDMFLVSVLLDAGAGNTWTFTEPGSNMRLSRSEGLAVASLYMFKNGLFTNNESGDSAKVDGMGLQKLTGEQLAEGMQATPQNPLVGTQDRAALLQRLGKSLMDLSEIFGSEGRPGNIVDYILSKGKTVDIRELWNILQRLLIPIWPSNRTVIDGHPIGDAWPLSTLGATIGDKNPPADVIQPFHKLTQWLTYSLTVPLQRLLGVTWEKQDLMTGLPEYRNGGLFVDMGVLSLKSEVINASKKDEVSQLCTFDTADDVIVEWRAMTVALLDKVAPLVVQRLAETTNQADLSLSMAQILEAGTWKAGRELAAKRRPDTRSSPILVESDGTVF